MTQEPISDVANSEIKKLESEQQQIQVELAEEGTKRDPVSSVKNAEMRSLADTYRFHAELLDELAKEISDWRAFQMQERERIETVKPPIEHTPLGNNRKPWGGPGF